MDGKDVNFDGLEATHFSNMVSNCVVNGNKNTAGEPISNTPSNLLSKNLSVQDTIVTELHQKAEKSLLNDNFPPCVNNIVDNIQKSSQLQGRPLEDEIASYSSNNIPLELFTNSVFGNDMFSVTTNNELRILPQGTPSLNNHNVLVSNDSIDDNVTNIESHSINFCTHGTNTVVHESKQCKTILYRDVSPSKNVPGSTFDFSVCASSGIDREGNICEQSCGIQKSKEDGECSSEDENLKSIILFNDFTNTCRKRERSNKTENLNIADLFHIGYVYSSYKNFITIHPKEIKFVLNFGCNMFLQDGSSIGEVIDIMGKLQTPFYILKSNAMVEKNSYVYVQSDDISKFKSSIERLISVQLDSGKVKSKSTDKKNKIRNKRRKTSGLYDHSSDLSDAGGAGEKTRESSENDEVKYFGLDEEDGLFEKNLAFFSDSIFEDKPWFLQSGSSSE